MKYYKNNNLDNILEHTVSLLSSEHGYFAIIYTQVTFTGGQKAVTGGKGRRRSSGGAFTPSVM